MTENEKSGHPALTPRAEITAYTTAFFSIGMLPMFHVIGPLWALRIGADPFTIGVAMGSRSALPFLFSIHSGALLDRLGVRRVMTVCALTSAVLTLLYPALPFIAALIALQVVTGFLHTIGWIGSQTQISQLTRGHPKYMGRFVSVSTFSNFLTPPLAGLVWDVGGEWSAFGLLSAWNLALWLSVSLMPVPDSVTVPTERPRLRALLPSPADYRDALRMVLAPAVGFVVACSFMMNSIISMRFAFLPVYMKEVGFEGTIIGLIVGFAFLVGGITALPTGFLRRFIPPQWIVLAMIVVAALGVGSVPLFRDVVGLTVATCIFGAGVGLGMAFVLSLLSTVVPTGQLGLSIGLRTTANRFSSFAIPIFAGAVIQFAGLAAGFYVTAAAIVACAALAAVFALRNPSIKRAFAAD